MIMSMATQNRNVFVPIRIDPRNGQVDIPFPVSGRAKCVAYIRNAVINLQGSAKLYFTNNPCHKVWGLIVEPSQGNFVEIYSDVVTPLGCKDIQRIEMPQMTIEIASPQQITIQQERVEDNVAQNIVNNLRRTSVQNAINIDNDLINEFKNILSRSKIYFV